jgi:hypothetical protein
MLVSIGISPCHEGGCAARTKKSKGGYARCAARPNRIPHAGLLLGEIHTEQAEIAREEGKMHCIEAA